MTDEEVNRIIANYMEERLLLKYLDSKYLKWFVDKFDDSGKSFLYTNSFDTLVPVWEKLRDNNQAIDPAFEYGSDHIECTLYLSINGKCKLISDFTQNTYQQAAAHATAKAILELNKQEELK